MAVIHINRKTIVLSLVCLLGLFSQAQAATLISFTKDGKYGFKDTNGNVVIAPIYEKVTNFVNELAFVMVDGKWAVIDSDNNFITQPIFDEIHPFVEEAARVKVDDYWGFIDTDGAFIFEPIFDKAADFNSEGVAKVTVFSQEILVSIKGTILWSKNSVELETNE